MFFVGHVYVYNISEAAFDTVIFLECLMFMIICDCKLYCYKCVISIRLAVASTKQDLKNNGCCQITQTNPLG